MRILLLAPHPFYQDRGTPIAVDLLLRTLAKRGDLVDVLTYSEGETRDYGKNITIHRIRATRFSKNIRPGFSLKKLFCDALMAPQAMRMARSCHYDCIHAVEESAFIARHIGRKLNIPYIFDMDSSMPRQIADKLPILTPLLPLMRLLENRVIRDATAVVPMCDAIAQDARAAGATYVELLRDISLLPANVQYIPEFGFRQACKVTGLTVLYIGNLEPYQGIDLLLESFAGVSSTAPDLSLIIAGGRADDIKTYQTKSETLSIAKRVHFLGPRPVSHMPHLFNDADILVSPRTKGQNTPMKIYSYLDAGKPLLATRLPTHTQVLNEEVALLVEPTRTAMAAGLLKLANTPDLRKQLAENAKHLAQSTYSLSAFEDAVNRIYKHLKNNFE